MEENSTPELIQEQIKRFELAIALSKEVIQELGIEDIGNYKKRGYSGLKCCFYKIEDERDVKIHVEVGYELGLIKLEFSIAIITNEIIEFIEKMLSNERISELLKPEVIKVLRDKDIDALTLFGLEESEVEDVIKDYSKKVLKMFFHNIPLFTRASVVDALANSLTGYYQHAVKELLKEYWGELGLPKDFSLLTQSDLEEIHKYNIDRKRWFLGDKKQLLNDWRLEGLADEAEDLRKQYSELKKNYGKLKSSFKLVNRGSTAEEWLEKWKDIQLSDYSTLNFKAMDLVEEYRPFELALIHLADFFGYDEETIRKKVNLSRKMKKQRQSKSG